MSTLSRMVVASLALCWGAGCMVPVESDESGSRTGADEVEETELDAAAPSDVEPLAIELREPADVERFIRGDRFHRMVIERGEVWLASDDALDAETPDSNLAAGARGEYVAGPDPDPWHLYPVDDPDSDEEAGPDPDPWEPQTDAESVEDDG